jgi:hypothetical protein
MLPVLTTSPKVGNSQFMGGVGSDECFGPLDYARGDTGEGHPEYPRESSDPHRPVIPNVVEERKLLIPV